MHHSLFVFPLPSEIHELFATEVNPCSLYTEQLDALLLTYEIVKAWPGTEAVGQHRPVGSARQCRKCTVLSTLAVRSL